MKLSRTGYGVLALATSSALLLSGCASGGGDAGGSTGGSAITVGTTEVVTSLAWRGISGFPMTHPPTTE